jgi:hypothetical protein
MSAAAKGKAWARGRRTVGSRPAVSRTRLPLLRTWWDTSVAGTLPAACPTAPDREQRRDEGAHTRTHACMVRTALKAVSWSPRKPASTAAVVLPRVRLRWSRVHSSMRPTKSVVDTPSVRLHSLPAPPPRAAGHVRLGRHRLRSVRNAPVAPSGLDNVVGVDTVGAGGDVIAVDHKVNVVGVQRRHLRHVRRILHHRVHPLACRHRQVPGQRRPSGHGGAARG